MEKIHNIKEVDKDKKEEADWPNGKKELPLTRWHESGGCVVNDSSSTSSSYLPVILVCLSVASLFSLVGLYLLIKAHNFWSNSFEKGTTFLCFFYKFEVLIASKLVGMRSHRVNNVGNLLCGRRWYSFIIIRKNIQRYINMNNYFGKLPKKNIFHRRKHEPLKKFYLFKNISK